MARGRIVDLQIVNGALSVHKKVELQPTECHIGVTASDFKSHLPEGKHSIVGNVRMLVFHKIGFNYIP